MKDEFNNSYELYSEEFGNSEINRNDEYTLPVSSFTSGEDYGKPPLDSFPATEYDAPPSPAKSAAKSTLMALLIASLTFSGSMLTGGSNAPAVPNTPPPVIESNRNLDLAPFEEGFKEVYQLFSEEKIFEAAGKLSEMEDALKTSLVSDGSSVELVLTDTGLYDMQAGKYKGIPKMHIDIANDHLSGSENLLIRLEEEDNFGAKIPGNRKILLCRSASSVYVSGYFTARDKCSNAKYQFFLYDTGGATIIYDVLGKIDDGNFNGKVNIQYYASYKPYDGAINPDGMPADGEYSLVLNKDGKIDLSLISYTDKGYVFDVFENTDSLYFYDKEQSVLDAKVTKFSGDGITYMTFPMKDGKSQSAMFISGNILK